MSQRVDGDLTGAFLPDYLYARSGWVAAHGADFATWGFGVAVRLRGGPGDAASFENDLMGNSKGWTIRDAGSVVDVDMPTLQRGVDSERQAVLIFALISAVASVAFVGLTLARQLRQEQSDRAALVALGLSESFPKERIEAAHVGRKRLPNRVRHQGGREPRRAVTTAAP